MVDQLTTSSKVALFRVVLCLFLFCVPNASAQIVSSPAPAGRSKSLEASAGFSYIYHDVSPSVQANLFGFDASATLGLSSRLAVKADLGYARSSNGLLGAPTHSGILNYMAGPVLYPSVSENYRTHVQVLFGGARVTGPVPLNGGTLTGGYATGFAWAVGGGVDYRLSESFGFGVGADYLNAGYFGPSLTIQGQKNLRAVASFIYFYSWRRKRR